MLCITVYISMIDILIIDTWYIFLRLDNTWEMFQNLQVYSIKLRRRKIKLNIQSKAHYLMNKIKISSCDLFIIRCKAKAQCQSRSKKSYGTMFKGINNLNQIALSISPTQRYIARNIQNKKYESEPSREEGWLLLHPSFGVSSIRRYVDAVHQRAANK